MKIYYEGLGSYKPWSGAVDTYGRIYNQGKIEALEALIEELYPEGIDETQLNDLLWFEGDWVYEALGMRTETQIKDEISDLQEQISDLETEYQDYIDDVETEEERKKLIEEFEEQKKDLQDEIDELKEELEEL